MMNSTPARKAEQEIQQRERELDSQRVCQLDERVGIPWNADVTPILTDLYQLTMAYAYWKAGTHEQRSVFEVFFRENPFKGEFTVMAGVNDVVRFVNTFHYNAEHIAYLKEIMPTCDSGFFDWLMTIDCADVTISAAGEGMFIFPREPIMRVEGPLALCQMLETTILNLLNFASLVTTNAARYRLAAGFDKKLLEFGLRRAQGPDGGMSASRYSFMGGFDATSNVRASFLFGLPCRGTHAHAYVTSFKDLDAVKDRSLKPSESVRDPPSQNFFDLVVSLRDEAWATYPQANEWALVEGELAAFIAYGQAFPNAFSALVDSYDVLLSGVPNYAFVAMALERYGYSVGSIRLDSGDLSYLSKKSRHLLNDLGTHMKCGLHKCSIIASNNISEEVLYALEKQNHCIDTFGIGTHLVTCYNQPALGMVYKLCELAGEPVMKISQEISKTTLPYKKEVYRLYDANDQALLDYIQLPSQEPPRIGERVYCQHISDDSKRCFVRPTRVEKLLRCVWKNGHATNRLLRPQEPMSSMPSSMIPATKDVGESPGRFPKLPSQYSSTQDDVDSDANSFDYDGKNHLDYLMSLKNTCIHSLKTFRADHLRPTNPTPFKISTSRHYAEVYKALWDSTAPVRTYQ